MAAAVGRGAGREVFVDGKMGAVGTGIEGGRGMDGGGITSIGSEEEGEGPKREVGITMPRRFWGGGETDEDKGHMQEKN